MRHQCVRTIAAAFCALALLGGASPAWADTATGDPGGSTEVTVIQLGTPDDEQHDEPKPRPLDQTGALPSLIAPILTASGCLIAYTALRIRNR